MNLVTAAHAQITNPAIPGMEDPSTGGEILGNLISTIVGAIITFAGVGAFIFLVIGGIQWLTAAGDKQALENARNRIINAIIGLIIVGVAWAATIFISNLFGFDFPNINLPRLVE